MTRRHYIDEEDFEDSSSGHSAFFFGFIAGISAALILVTGGVMGAAFVFFEFAVG